MDHVKVIRNRPDIRFERRIHEQLLPAIRRVEGEVAWTDIFVVHAGSESTPFGRRRKCARDLRLIQLELQDAPSDTFAWFNLGMTYNDMDRHRAAVAAMRRSIELAHPDESHVRKAYAILTNSLHALGQTDDALATARTGLEWYRDDSELRFYEGGESKLQMRQTECRGFQPIFKRQS